MNRINLAVAAPLLVALLGGCTLDAENPGAITDAGLTEPTAVVALVNGVVGDYTFAYHRSSLYSGLISDEIRSSGSYSTWRAADRNGVIDPLTSSPGVQNISNEWWSRLQRARVISELATERVEAVMPEQGRAGLLATTRLFSGMAYRDIGEYFCAAAYDAGPRVERAQTLELADRRLSDAIELAQGAGIDSIARMGRLIRAQVRLSQGRLDEALADARAVPTGFLWSAQYRQGGHESNETVTLLNEQALATVEEPFWNTGDPRVPVKANGKGTDGVTPRWDQQKYAKFASMPMGKGQEARLIEAEILISRGEVAAGVQALNQVRAAAGLAPLPADLSAAAATTALRTERKHELFLEGERMLDMRRWQLFPAGWQAGCVPIPGSEIAGNPNL